MREAEKRTKTASVPALFDRMIRTPIAPAINAGCMLWFRLGQKVLLAIKQMGGESTEAWRTVLDDLVRRGLR
jgi:hypothetical protein